MFKELTLVDICIMIFTGIAAYAAFFEYVIKYKNKNRNICNQLLIELTKINQDILKFKPIWTKSYETHKDYMFATFEDLNIIHECFTFFYKYNKMLENNDFIKWLEQYRTHKSSYPGTLIEPFYVYDFSSFIKMETTKISTKLTLSMQLNEPTFNNLDFYTFVDNIHIFKYEKIPHANEILKEKTIKSTDKIRIKLFSYKVRLPLIIKDKFKKFKSYILKIEIISNKFKIYPSKLLTKMCSSKLFKSFRRH